MGMFGDIGATATSSMGANWEIGLSLIGRLAAQGNYDRADEIYENIIQNINAEDVPKFQELIAQQVPDLAAMQKGSSGRTAQQNAINRLQSFVDQDGLDDQARNQLQQSQSIEDQRSRGNREAIMQSRARRGLGGSGDELSALLSDNQGSANRGRDASLQIASDARQRALSALGQQGQLAGAMRGQDISIDKANMDAAHQRELFNAKMRMASAQGNNEGRNNEYMMTANKNDRLNKAKGRKAQRYLEGAEQTQKDWAGVGRGMNMKHQGAAEGAQEMPW